MGGGVTTGDLPLGIPSGFARRVAGRLEGRRTSPAARLLLFGNLLDFVSAAGEKKKRWKDVVSINKKIEKRYSEIHIKLLINLFVCR